MMDSPHHPRKIMAEEYDNLDLDLESLDENIERKNKVEERIMNLSKRENEAQRRADAAEAEVNELRQAKDAADKEIEFFSSFTESTSKYPDAIEYKDIIKERVLAGYTVEDATISVLAKEGKFVAQPPVETPAVKAESPAGGSATTQKLAEGIKPIAEMTQEERKAALEETLQLS